MPSKIVVDKQKSTREMLSIVKASVDGLAAEIASRLSKENNGDEKSIQEAAKLLVQLPCNRVEKNCAAMIKADDEYIRGGRGALRGLMRSLPGCCPDFFGAHHRQPLLGCTHHRP